MAEEVPAEAGKTVYLLLDNASSHNSHALNWHHIKPSYLSPFSPDFNPIERLWQYLKDYPMAGFLTNDGDALTQRLLEPLSGLHVDNKLVQSVCAVPTFNRK